jgi:hypothetical protein
LRIQIALKHLLEVCQQNLRSPYNEVPLFTFGLDGLCYEHMSVIVIRTQFWKYSEKFLLVRFPCDIGKVSNRRSLMNGKGIVLRF